LEPTAANTTLQCVAANRSLLSEAVFSRFFFGISYFGHQKKQRKAFQNINHSTTDCDAVKQDEAVPLHLHLINKLTTYPAGLIINNFLFISNPGQL